MSAEASYTWTLGVKVGLPIAAAAALLIIVWLLVSLAYALRNHTKGKRWSYISGWERWSDRRRGALSAGAAFACLVALVVPLLFGYYPYNASYHQYRDVSGTVAQISSRFVPAGQNGDGTEQRFVVVLTSGPQQYGIDDTRAALLHKGSTVHLRCIRQHVSGSTDDGYVCQWGGQS